ncbi:MAG: hypothetical protein QF464_14995 [Myxococcota bacterium]|nr:hypothetical protein [Myxococcota bacterium]
MSIHAIHHASALDHSPACDACGHAKARQNPAPWAAPLRETTACPFCCEQILLGARKCKHCTETVCVVLRAAEEATRAKHAPMTFMNAGGGGASSSASASASSPAAEKTKHKFPHGPHFLASILTLGYWSPMWLLHYVFRSRSYYA